MFLKKNGNEVVNWIELAKDRVQRQTLVFMMLNYWFLISGNLFEDRG